MFKISSPFPVEDILSICCELLLLLLLLTATEFSLGGMGTNKNKHTYNEVTDTGITWINATSIFFILKKKVFLFSL
jgi:hypothetical protein